MISILEVRRGSERWGSLPAARPAMPKVTVDNAWQLAGTPDIAVGSGELVVPLSVVITVTVDHHLQIVHETLHVT